MASSFTAETARGAIRALAVGLCLAAGGLPSAPCARERLSPAEMTALAASTLQAGAPREAATLADALLARDPADVPVLILRAEAAVMLHDFPAVRRHAARAFRAAKVDTARYAAARLMALAHSQEGRQTVAQFWLRRARQAAPTEAARRSVADDYRYLRQENPLSYSLDFSVAPTDNVNNGKANETVLLDVPFLGALPFELSGDALPLSGTELRAGGSLRYRLARGPGGATFAEAGGYLSTYRLSDDARETAPEAEGADYAEAQATLGLVRFWSPEGSRTTWRARLSGGRFWHGGEPMTDFVRGEAGALRRLGPQTRLDLAGHAADYDNAGDRPDDRMRGLRAAVTHDGFAFGAVEVELGVSRQDSEAADRAFDATRAEVSLGVDRLGATFSYGVERRGYDAALLSEDRREDTRHTARVTVAVPRAEFYGFEPTVTVEREVNRSTIDLHETERTGLALGFRSAF